MPLPLSTNVTPLGSVPVSAIAAAGKPVVVIVTELCWSTRNESKSRW